MKRLTLIFAIVAVATCVTSFSQAPAPPTPSPTPKPQVRRPGLDQFGLGSGVFASRPSSSTTADYTIAGVKEYVDPHIFEVITVGMEKSRFMERELDRVLKADASIDLSPDSNFTKYFLHHMFGLVHVSETQRTRQFGGAGIKGVQLNDLLVQNRDLVSDMVKVMTSGAKEYAQSSKELNGVSEKYGVSLLQDTSDAMPLDKRSLLKSMMVRINSTYSKIKAIMVAKE